MIFVCLHTLVIFIFFIIFKLCSLSVTGFKFGLSVKEAIGIGGLQFQFGVWDSMLGYWDCG